MRTVFLSKEADAGANDRIGIHHCKQPVYSVYLLPQYRMPKSLKDYNDIIRTFCEERNWSNTDPNQLINSIFIELAELAEHFQWQNQFKERSEEEQKALDFEFVDVFFYLMELADRANVDLEAAFDEKLPKLRAKFPVGQTAEEHKAVRKEYRESGKNKLYE